MTKTITSRELEKLEKKYQSHIESHQTFVLSTVSKEGLPDISYAPFIRDDRGVFYIFISELAQHTDNLLNNPECSVFIGQPEQEKKTPFACERVIFHCRASEILKADFAYESRLDQMQARLGETVTLLRSLPDFHLFALVPQSGQYISGFARAFNISADGSLTHRHV